MILLSASKCELLENIFQNFQKMRKKLHFEILKNAYHEIYIKKYKVQSEHRKKISFFFQYHDLGITQKRNKSYTIHV